MRRVYQEIAERKRNQDDASAFFTPYQIMLPLLQALYFQFEKEDEVIEEKTILKGILSGRLTAKNPASRTGALKTSLRAIAYFSWEPESRVFLVRRVFPTYFDFLSVSHIPEGWGVSSIMLKELHAAFSKQTVTNGDFLSIVDLEDPPNLPYTLPYLAEQKRLEYEHVLILPVFQPNSPKSDRDMLGTFLFFVSEGDCVPTSYTAKKRFRDFARPLCKATSELVVAHKEALATTSLATRWRETRSLQQAEARIAEVVLSCIHAHAGGTCSELETAAREFWKALTIPNYFAIRDSDAEQNQETAVFLVTARPDVDLQIFKKRLLQVVTEQLSETKIVCQVTIKAGNLAAGGAFHLKADHEWQCKSAANK